MWLCNSPEDAEVYLHWLHLCGFSPACFLFMCFLRPLGLIVVYTRIGCSGGVSLHCVLKCVFSESQFDWMNSSTVCTYVVSPQCEWENVTSSDYFDWRICRVASWTIVPPGPIVGLLMSPKATSAGERLWALVTRHQILHRCKLEPLPRPLGWLLNIEQKWGQSNETLSLSQCGYCTSLFDPLSKNLFSPLHWCSWS